MTRIVKDYDDDDSRYINYPEQQKKKRYVDRIYDPATGGFERIIREKRVYDPDAPHPDNKDW